MGRSPFDNLTRHTPNQSLSHAPPNRRNIRLAIPYNPPMLIDLHSHTAPLSYDALQTPEQLVLEAKGLDLDGLCLTEHDAFWDADALARLGRRHGILLLPGCEVNTNEGHFLAFGLNEYVFGMHKLPFLWQQIQAANGALVAAHPYRRRGIASHPTPDLASKVEKAAAEPIYRQCHAIETLNGRGSKAENAFSTKLARTLKLPAVGGSDSHSPGDLGVCATRFNSTIRNLDDLIAALRRGNYAPIPLNP